MPRIDIESILYFSRVFPKKQKFSKMYIHSIYIRFGSMTRWSKGKMASQIATQPDLEYTPSKGPGNPRSDLPAVLGHFPKPLVAFPNDRVVKSEIMLPFD